MLEKLWKTSIFRRIPGCKASLHFNKMPKSLRQVFQKYSETCIHEIHTIVNLGQKYEGDLEF